MAQVAAGAMHVGIRSIVTIVVQGEDEIPAAEWSQARAVTTRILRRAGLATLGTTTAGALFLNGGVLGFVGTELLERHQFGMFMTAVAPQLALEVGAYVVAAGATLRLGWSIWWPLVSRRRGVRVQWRGWLVAESAAVLMLFSGAIVEATFSHV